MDAKTIVKRLLAYVAEESDSIRAFGNAEDAASIENVIYDAGQFLQEAEPATAHLTPQELNTVLACIRHCQEEKIDLSHMDHFQCEDYDPLPWDKVDELIEEKLYGLGDGELPPAAARDDGDPEYTVVGLYDDNSQPWCTVVRAKTPIQAAAEAVKDMRDTNHFDGVDDIRVVEVFEGRCRSTAVTQTEMSGEQVFELAREEGWE